MVVMVVEMVRMRPVAVEQEEDKDEEERDGAVVEGRTRFHHYCSWF